jgi:hypothetical protein
MSRTVLICVVLFSTVLSVHAQLIVPSDAEIVIAGEHYTVSFETGLIGPVYKADGIHLARVASEVVCPVAGLYGQLRVSSELIPAAQAKALIHEVVHISQTCDKRDLPVEERIAQDVSDLLNSAVGPFVVKELTR